MRDADRRGRTVMLRLRFDDFSRATRSHTLPRSTSQTPEVLGAIRDLMAAAEPLVAERGLTLIGISVAGFRHDDDAVQLELPFREFGATALDSALDDVRHRFGSAALTRGVLLGRDSGWTMPMLPD